MVSRAKKCVVIYGLLLLSSVIPGEAQLVGQTQTFSHTQGFKNTQGFTNTQGFGNPLLGNAPVFPNTYPAPVPFSHVNPASNFAKGYGSPLYNSNFYYDYTHPVNAQYWTGHSLPVGNQWFSQQYGYQQGGYVGYGQPYGYAGYQSWGYPQKYGYWGVHPAYSGQYVHYPNFNANYWTGHPAMYAQVYPQPIPYYGAASYPYYQQPYFYGRPRSFLADFARSDMAKGLLGALVVGVVAGKVARGK